MLAHVFSFICQKYSAFVYKHKCKQKDPILTVKFCHNPNTNFYWPIFAASCLLRRGFIIPGLGCINYGSMDHGLMKNVQNCWIKISRLKLQCLFEPHKLDNLDNVRLETSWRFGSKNMQQYLKDIMNTLQMT